MSDCNKPTYQFHSKAYNATEVRLYGIPPQAPVITSNGEEYDLRIELLSKRNRRESKKDSDASAARMPKLGLILRSALFMDAREFHPLLAFLSMGYLVINGKVPDSLPKHSSGIIFGYAFEGHCYELPKPKLMVLPVSPEDIKCDDCGYGAKSDCGYKVWVVDKLDRCLELELNQGFVEHLVLDANLPGRRSPSTYRATMVMSHRSGRLTD